MGVYCSGSPAALCVDSVSHARGLKQRCPSPIVEFLNHYAQSESRSEAKHLALHSLDHDLTARPRLS